MYPFRDWVTCVDGCVQPQIQKQLVGNERGFIAWILFIFKLFKWTIMMKNCKNRLIKTLKHSMTYIKINKNKYDTMLLIDLTILQIDMYL